MSQLLLPAAPRVLSVGQCGFDHRSISGYLADRFGAEVERAHSLDDTRDAMMSAHYDLTRLRLRPTRCKENGSGRA
jgi:hypothetical protein